MRKRRHPFRGIIGGLLLGLALGLGSVVYGFNALGPSTPLILVGVGLIIGILFIFIPSRKAMRAKPPAAGSAPAR